MLIWSVFWTVSLFLSPETDVVPLGARLTHDIQASVYSRQPTVWGGAEQTYDIRIEWTPKILSGPLVYRRQVRRSPDGGELLLESWRFSPDDLATFLAAWNHPDKEVDWSRILGTLPNGRLIASQSRGLLLIVRQYPPGTQVWKEAPFPLDAVPTEAFPNLAQPVVRGEGGLEDESHETSKFADFFADLFVEELLDREGVPIRISKHWDISGRFSRLSPLVRIERRIRLDFSGTYSVFDLYTIGGEVLLGSRREDIETRDFSETGTFLDIQKKVVVIRKGYQKWYEALFAKPFSLRKIPYSDESLMSFPIGVRVVFPSSAGLTLIGKRSKPTHIADNIPLDMQVFAGLNGTSFISLTKTSQNVIDFTIGGRVERVGEASLRMRPDFDGTFDPLRLLMGTLSQLRANKTKGTSLFMQKQIDLTDPEQVALYRQSVRRGLRLSGFPLGVAAVLNLVFRQEWDDFFVEQALQDKLPEIQWERTYLSHYSHFEKYAKLGIRPISSRSRTFAIDDDWVIEDRSAPEPTRARSFSLNTTRNLRLPGRLSQRVIQANGIIDKTDADAEAQGQYLEVVDLTDRSRMSYAAYRKLTGRLSSCFAPSADLSELSQWTPDAAFHDVQIGYRIVLNRRGLEKLAAEFIDLRKNQKSHPLSRWLRFHPILWHRLERIERDPEGGFVALSKLLFKLAKRRGPIHCLFETLDPQDYLLEWRGMGLGRPLVSGRIGESVSSDALIHMMRDWEALGVLDNVFVERNFNARLQ